MKVNSIYAKNLASDYTASYASYVATSRSVPQLTDGLKPVHRRCINSADDLKLYHDRKFLKVAKLEGQVMGDYHPHGGASPVILAQPFKIRYPLFDGQGNFGSPDSPDSVAASRYIECRLTKFCEDFYLSSSDYADREDNYDGRLKEVVRYYPPIPGSLLTGASGIAVGLSTNIPPHTISDVCKSLLSYIRYPNSESYINCLMPDTCEESIILTPRSEIAKLYKTGEGSIQYKAKTHYESIEGKLALVVDAFPPDYSKKRIMTSSILEAVESGNLELRNESKEGIRYVFLSQDKDILASVEDRLVNSSGYRLYIEHDNKIKLYKLSEIYDDFLTARKAYVIKKYTDLIKKNEYELEFIRVLLELKRDRDYIKSMFDKSPKDVVKDIIKRYNTSQDIASKVIASSLSSLMKDNMDKLLSKSKELEKDNKIYLEYVNNPITKIVLDIKELQSAYKNEKRNATHIDDIKSSIEFSYQGNTIVAHPSDIYYIATHDNHYEQTNAAELATLNLKDKIVVSADYDYYVFYDENGLIAVTKDTMSRLDNKFRSTRLSGILGVNNLSDVRYTLDEKKIFSLGEWALRTRLSYIKQTESGNLRIYQGVL